MHMCMYMHMHMYMHMYVCGGHIGWRVVLGEVQSPIRAHRTTHHVLRNHSDVNATHEKGVHAHMQTQGGETQARAQTPM